MYKFYIISKKNNKKLNENKYCPINYQKTHLQLDSL